MVRGNARKQSTDKNLARYTGNLPKITMTTEDNQTQKLQEGRKQSTGTLNRLILVAQALETEVDSRRGKEASGTKCICTIRMTNLVILFLMNVLILTGVGQYQSASGSRSSIVLTADKWFFSRSSGLPPTFSEMALTGQFFSAALSLTMFLAVAIVQVLHCCRIRHSKLLCLCYSFGCVPFSLFVFGLEMHYSACPWLDDFYRVEIMRRDFHSVEKYFETQCGINGWAVAGIFSLISCVLFVIEGLLTAFFRSSASHTEDAEKATTEVIL